MCSMFSLARQLKMYINTTNTLRCEHPYPPPIYIL